MHYKNNETSKFRLKKTALIIGLFLSFLNYAQEITTENFPSENLKVNRNFKIYTPQNYPENETKNYPLTIVLDDDILFDLYVNNAKMFFQKDKAPQQIIVGINTKNTLGMDISFNKETGNLTDSAYSFYLFIRDEVIFHMESNYRTSPFVTLVASGYSANFITSFLSEDTLIVNSYICINPTFSNFIGNQLISYNLDKFAKMDSSFYFYTNNSNTFSKKKHTQIKLLQEGLAPVSIKNFNIINDSINTFNSLSAKSEVIPRAISKVFEIYAAITKNEFESKLKNLSPANAITYLEEKYINIEYLFGSSLGIRERDIFAIEEIIIEKENGDYLRDFGDMILKIYPTSLLGNYYIGKYYETGRNYKKALKHYKIAFGKMDPADPNTDSFYENIERINKLSKK